MRDLDIRLALHAKLQAQFAEDPTTRILDEFGVHQGASRIDVAVVNGVLHGYEIKSARDTLHRLPGQEAAYSKVFDRLTIIVSPGHLEAVQQKVPGWWRIDLAVLTARGVKLRRVRGGRQNKRVEMLAVAELLWRDEVLEILERHGHADGIRSKPRAALWRQLADRLTPEELKEEVRSTLKNRPSSWLAPAPRG